MSALTRQFMVELSSQACWRTRQPVAGGGAPAVCARAHRPCEWRGAKARVGTWREGLCGPRYWRAQAATTKFWAPLQSEKPVSQQDVLPEKARTYIHTYQHTYKHTGSYWEAVVAAAYIHTYIHTYINTYIHTYILRIAVDVDGIGSKAIKPENLSSLAAGHGLVRLLTDHPGFIGPALQRTEAEAAKGCKRLQSICRNHHWGLCNQSAGIVTSNSTACY
jgi:hypothetical protein